MGKNLSISIQEETLSLNTGALAQLMRKDDEEEIDAMLQGLIDVVPELPLNEEKLEIFLSTLKSLLPDVEIETGEAVHEQLHQNEEEFYSNTIESIDEFNFDEMDSIDIVKQKPKVNVDKLILKRLQSVILTKRPTVTAGVLHELTQISEKPQGTIKETSLGVILDEYNKFFDEVKRNITVYYENVDALLTDKEGYDKLKEMGLIDDKEMGKFKVDKVFTEFAAISDRRYVATTIEGDRVFHCIKNMTYDNVVKMSK